MLNKKLREMQKGLAIESPVDLQYWYINTRLFSQSSHQCVVVVWPVQFAETVGRLDLNAQSFNHFSSLLRACKLNAIKVCVNCTSLLRLNCDLTMPNYNKLLHRNRRSSSSLTLTTSLLKMHFFGARIILATTALKRTSCRHLHHRSIRVVSPRLSVAAEP